MNGAPRLRTFVGKSFPTRHTRPYCSQRRARVITGGEAGGGCTEIWCPVAISSGGLSDPKFLTIAEVAALMRVSKMTVYRLVHGGELPAVRVGRSFRVSEDDVDEYLRKSFYNAG